MPYFLFAGSYTPESLSSLVQNPEDRSVYIKSILMNLGGKLEGFYLAFGEYDFYVIGQLPDTQTAAAFAMSACAGGGVHNFRTIPLLTWPEGMNAMQQAGRAGYRPPGAARK